MAEKNGLKGKKIGFALTGSHCTLNRVLAVYKELAKEKEAEVYPILSPSVLHTDTRFGSAEHWRKELETICGNTVISSIRDAEPIGPERLLDAVIIAPASGNTIAKLVNGVVDTSVLMAAKAHLRNGGPLIIAVSTNDGLGISAKNIGLLLNMKNVFFVPFGQDDPLKKPNSLVAKMEMIVETTEKALIGQQIQPILIEY